MATSGVTTNQLTRNQFIEAALRKIGALAIDQTPAATEYTNGTIALNGLIGEFRALQMPIWARTSTSFALTASTQSYNIGSSQTINVPYPIHILQAWRVDTGSTTRVPMEIIPNFNINLYPTTSAGRPIQINYQPKINQGVLQVWPVPDADAVTNCTVYIVYQRPYEYFNGSTDTLDMPEEWVHPVIYQLAVRLAPEYGLPLMERQQLAKEAGALLELALQNGTEDASIFFQPHRHA